MAKPNKAFVGKVIFKVVYIPVKAKNKAEARKKLRGKLQKHTALRYITDLHIINDKD